MKKTNELSLMDCRAPVSRGFGEGTKERGIFKRNPATGLFEKIERPKSVEIDAPALKREEYLDGIHSMADDKVYYSRSAYEKSLKRLGYEITGGDHLTGTGFRDKHYELSEEKSREISERAYYDVKYDRVQFTEAQKQQHIEEKRMEDAWRKRNGR